MIIEYTENDKGYPILVTVNKGKVFPLVDNELDKKDGTYKMSLSVKAKGFFRTLSTQYNTVEDFSRQSRKLMKMSVTASSMIECVYGLDEFSIAILALLKEVDR